MTQRFREEKDTMGTVRVAEEALWGAQTQRSIENFPIGGHRFPRLMIKALGIIKQAAARTNHQLGKLPESLAALIDQAAEEVKQGKWDDQFPLVVWQTGSGTQTNMNANEVIANRAIQIAGGKVGSKDPVHPNDHVNQSQSSNDVFPTAMHVAAVEAIESQILPSIRGIRAELKKISERYKSLVKIGRTHCMDATPLTLGQEFSAYVSQFTYAENEIKKSCEGLYSLALGGSAVGTGINTHPKYAAAVAAEIAKISGFPFVTAENKFMALAGNDAFVIASGAIKNAAVIAFKMANDIRLLASGPRCGIGEIEIPSNEPGSSIMPGKVNPTQCEALTMVATQVIGHDASIAMAATQGHFQLNVFKPVIIHNFLEAVKLLSEALDSFKNRCLDGLVANEARIRENLNRSLMLVTALNQTIGYDKAAQIAKKAHHENKTLKEAAMELKFVTAEEFDRIVDPQKMI